VRDPLSPADSRPRLTPALTDVIVLGVGNELRGDDGAGPEVVRLVRERAVQAGITAREYPGDPLGLLDAWRGYTAAVIVDAMRCDSTQSGTIRRLDAGQGPLPAEGIGPASTHAVGFGEVLELARVLGRLPSTVIVYAVWGAQFAVGSGLSTEVRAALPTLGEAVLAEALRLRSG
jgi:hydrogenase maturation protease